MEAMVDLPFALPTAVSGIALTAIFTPRGWLGGFFNSMGMPVAFTPAGIVVAMTFIGLPFVVRTLQPALANLEKSQEEMAFSLGASPFKTFRKVTFPTVFPALLTGFSLAFARALGEYGSIIFISGNMPMKTEITSLLIVTRLEQYDYKGAAVIAVVMLILAFLLLLFINTLQSRISRNEG
jgi:sulfate transport system permease protein